MGSLRRVAGRRRRPEGCASGSAVLAILPSARLTACTHGRLPEWPMGADCKSVGLAFVGSNPTAATQRGAPREIAGRPFVSGVQPRCCSRITPRTSTPRTPRRSRPARASASMTKLNESTVTLSPGWIGSEKMKSLSTSEPPDTRRQADLEAGRDVALVGEGDREVGVGEVRVAGDLEGAELDVQAVGEDRVLVVGEPETAVLGDAGVDRLQTVGELGRRRCDRHHDEDRDQDRDDDRDGAEHRADDRHALAARAALVAPGPCR